MHFYIYIFYFITIIIIYLKKNLTMIFTLKKLFTIILIFGVFLSLPIYGADTPDQIEYQGFTLTKNGQGTRIIFFMKVYEGSLYLETTSSNAEEIIS